MATTIVVNAMGPDLAISRGHWMLVTCTGFPASVAAAVFMGDAACTPPGLQCRADCVTDASGNLTAFVPVPQFGTPAGTYTVTVKAGGSSAAAPVTVA